MSINTRITLPIPVHWYFRNLTIFVELKLYSSWIHCKQAKE